jgi:pimeloyl-ACP methyl ester carboxylesterase
LRAWIEAGRSLAGRQPRRYESLDAAHRRMQEANPHQSPEQARHLTIHGTNQNEDGTYSWKFDNYVHAGPAVDLGPDEVALVWRNIACPVLLVAGGESWQRDEIESGAFDDAFVDARHVIIEDAGHWVQHDQLDAFVELITSFVEPSDEPVG